MRATRLTILAACVAAPVYAQPVTKDAPAKTTVPVAGKLDRAAQPKAGPAPVTRIPTWTRTTLPNGAELVVVEKHDLPLVSLTVNFVGGANNFEPADKLGVASFTAQMLSEGTATRSADQISDAQQMLGTSIGAGVGGESGAIGFTALKDKLEPALALLADMLEHPAFPADALERIRGRALVGLTQAKDNPNAIASNVFARVLYGDAHPYGRVVTETTVKNITRDDVVAFHKQYFQPGRAVITVSGDVRPAQVKAAVEKALAGWQSGGARPTFDYPAAPAPKAAAIYLVDKPGAAQSVFAIGLTGPARDTPDYYALQVMNRILGGWFQSRINHNIREVKGYSYGVNSSFAYGRGPGPFRAGGGVVTAKTDSALIEFVKEFKGVRGDIPFTDEEVAQAKAAIVQGLPSRFASVDAIASAIGSLYVQDLPESFYRDYAKNIEAVTRDDLVRAAQKYVDMDHLNIVIVGDRATIAEPLRKTGIAPIVTLDIEGKPVP